MKQTIELDKEDIKQLIAKEFGIKESQVSVVAIPTYQGQGCYEYKQYEVCAIISK